MLKTTSQQLEQELKFGSLIFAIPLHNEINCNPTKHLKELTNSKQDSAR